MGFLSNHFNIVPQYLHGLVSPRQAPLSLGNAESLLNEVLLLDIDNNLVQCASVVISANPRAWFPSRAPSLLYLYYVSTLELPTITVVPQ
jgi:hypothetical protein